MRFLSAPNRDNNFPLTVRSQRMITCSIRRSQQTMYRCTDLRVPTTSAPAKIVYGCVLTSMYPGSGIVAAVGRPGGAGQPAEGVPLCTDCVYPGSGRVAAVGRPGGDGQPAEGVPLCTDCVYPGSGRVAAVGRPGGAGQPAEGVPLCTDLYVPGLRQSRSSRPPRWSWSASRGCTAVY